MNSYRTEENNTDDSPLPVNGRTKLACLLGSPVAHSISPVMHNEAFRHLGLNCVYLAFDVSAETFPAAVDGLIALNAVGWNCTMPLKRLMYERCDALSDTARLTGAVNTVVNDCGRLVGHNTDGYGFMQSMADAGISAAERKMTLLGAGGASAAILAQAALDGAAAIDVFCRPGSASTARITEEAERIRESTACRLSVYDVQDFTALKKSLSESHILVNGSSVGMAPHTDACLIPDKSFLPPDLAVGDVIYNPAKTRLLQMAEEAGCRTFNGMYMLLHQGAAAFRHWTGREMPVELVRRKYFR